MKLTFLDDTLFNSMGQQSQHNVVNSNDILPKVLTIGNFDGLHLGHQAMINQTLETAKVLGLQTAVMVFEPMPKEFFAPKTAPARLTNLAETKQIFADFDYQGMRVDELIVAEFTKAFSSLSAQEFADILIHQLNVKAVVLGDDFRFGNDRKGDGDFLRACGLQVARLKTITDVTHDNKRISSTRIRQLLKEGALTQANQLLGRDYYMIGEVQHGDKIGRTLNFPTANVALDRIKPALHGVFAVDVQILDKMGNVCLQAWQKLAEENQLGVLGLKQDSLFGTANVGTRPAVDGLQWRLEVHFPNFKGNLYGKTLKVRFLHFLHGERDYEGLEALQAGIKADVAELLVWRNAQVDD